MKSLRLPTDPGMQAGAVLIDPSMVISKPYMAETFNLPTTFRGLHKRDDKLDLHLNHWYTLSVFRKKNGCFWFMACI